MVKEETINRYKEYIGKDFGCIHVDDIDLSAISKNRIYFFCTCTKCGAKLRIRNDGLLNKHPCECCIKCIGKWRSANFAEMYKDKLPKIIRVKYQHFRKAAIDRGIPFNLTLEEANEILCGKCYYCGKEHCLGIDRVDNSKGYDTENCVPCCGCCNKMKMDLELSFFLDQIKRIYDNLETIKSSTTISKESTSKTFVDGNGVHLSHKQTGGDIV